MKTVEGHRASARRLKTSAPLPGDNQFRLQPAKRFTFAPTQMPAVLARDGWDAPAAAKGGYEPLFTNML